MIDKIKEQLNLYSEICTILNNIQDDLTLDLGKGENGYSSYEDSYKAVKNNTLKLLKRRESKLRRMKLNGRTDVGRI
jgi:hypothetical protein